MSPKDTIEIPQHVSDRLGIRSGDVILSLGNPTWFCSVLMITRDLTELCCTSRDREGNAINLKVKTERMCEEDLEEILKGIYEEIWVRSAKMRDEGRTLADQLRMGDELILGKIAEANGRIDWTVTEIERLEDILKNL